MKTRLIPLLLLSLSASAHPFKLVVNEDNDHYFHLDRSFMTREKLREYVDCYAAGGKVSHIFWTACGQPANYDSKAWEPVWERLDDPDYQKLDSTRKPGKPNWPENCKLLRDQGIDPYAVWIERCRERGISPWISMRMNDVHFATHRRMQPGRTVRFWREHPELRRHPEWDPFDPAHREWKLFAFDYAKEEVRRYSLGMARELIERYLPDGLELDWMRYVCHLTPGRERELAPVLTDFMREVRRIADAAGAKAGRRIALAARIPSRYGYARDLGYDPETWAREGLCDLFIVCNKDSADFGCDVADWSRRLSPAAVIPGADRFDCTHGERVYADLAGYRGWADAMYARGAEGLYLFNAIYLPERTQDELWAKGLDPAVALSGPRRYVATYPDSAPDNIPEKSLCQLPRPLNAPVSLELFAGSGRTDGALSVVLAFDREIEASKVRLELNGVPSVGAPTELKDFGKLYGDPKLSKRAWRWTLPEKALRRDRNRLDIAAVPGSEASVAWAEIATGAAVCGGATAHVVEEADAYNCWPMVQSVGNRLICLYTRGARHNPGERGRGTYAKVSDDGGATWSDRVTVAQDERSGETPVAKGLDENGAALFWVRRFGPKKLFALYRTRDGRSFEQVCEWTPDPKPMQITDVFAVPGVGLMAFWFGGSYADDDRPRWWGTVTSADNGKTWTQRVCGEGMRKADWPTEPSGVFLGNGRILAIARTEAKGRQFQLTSRDSGRTWKVERTNIDDVSASTPSLLYDPKTDLVTQYYYQRGAGVLRRRTARAADVFDAPTAWPTSEKLVSDGGNGCDAGNANAVKCGERQCVVYYTGKRPHCAVMSLTLP